MKTGWYSLYIKEFTLFNALVSIVTGSFKEEVIKRGLKVERAWFPLLVSSSGSFEERVYSYLDGRCDRSKKKKQKNYLVNLDKPEKKINSF